MNFAFEIFIEISSPIVVMLSAAIRPNGLSHYAFSTCFAGCCYAECRSPFCGSATKKFDVLDILSPRHVTNLTLSQT